MDLRRCTSLSNTAPLSMGAVNFINRVHGKVQIEDHEETADYAAPMDADVDLREIYFLIMQFLSTGPCQKSFKQLWSELLEYELLPRRYHAWYSRSGEACGEENDNGNSFPLNYDKLVERYSHIEKNHLVKLLKQLMLITSPPLRSIAGNVAPSATDVPTLLGVGSFSLLSSGENRVIKQVRNVPSYLRWPHMKADQVRGLRLREIGGGFSKHHRAPSIRLACYAIAKPSAVVGKMQNQKKLRGHRDAVYCAIFDRTGRYVITGSDDRLVKIWSMETAFCLSSCRGHEGDITDLSVSSNNALVASASNDYSIRVWRLPDGLPISVLRGHTGAVTAIAFCPRPNAVFHLLSSSDDGTCRIWDARSSQYSPRVYSPKPIDAASVKSSGLPSASSSSINVVQSHQILCCAYNANGTVFVTGSSDTFARVWNACSKPNTNDPEQPTHEIDRLAGHENDVNYVQFSGCAVASRASPSESFVEDSIPKFKNNWFSHDNIVTCSRDGSAIIWIPKTRRSHNKVGRWIWAYHLKVPPPPMPPQPPRGGPRQRLLPTPRGVNMIVWSLDNRFVLAAIMDNRICVWNANDGSLVHSLAGHTASTYVLDVHPFNPRIAMSAGYDGKTILWDIWEGTPIRVYEIDERFKLVDGKFSQDGTSIVLSDDVGQIYLLNTGEGESQKDAKYDQFFLGDYRPLTRDTHGNVVDQETQLVPYYRNIQDRLCDSSMLPYPEPYQSMYQRSRLGALGIEWRPSSIKFAIGTDIGMGQEFQILPLADLDVVIEPLPDYLDPLYWEPDNDVINDDNDSEYNATEEHFSDEQACRSDNTSVDSDCSEEDKIRRNQKDSMRRSKRKKSISEIDSVISSGRRGRVRKRITDGQDGSLSKNKRYKKSKIGQRTSRRKSIKPESSRPQRVTALNAINISSTEEDYVSMSDSSDSESSLEMSSSDEQMKHATVASDSEDVVKPFQHPDLPINNENKKKLVVRFSLSRTAPKCSENQASVATSTLRTTEDIPEEVRVNSISRDLGSSSPSIVRFSLNRAAPKYSENQARSATSTLRDTEDIPEEVRVNSISRDLGSSSPSIVRFSLSRTAPKCLENQASAATSTLRANDDIPEEEVRVNSVSRDLGSSSPSIVDTQFSENLKGADIDSRTSTSCTNAHVSWGKFKVRTSSSTQLGDVVRKNVNAIKNNGCLTDEDKQNSGEGEKGSSSSHICGPSNVIVDAKENGFEPQDNPKKKLIVLKLKPSKVPGNSNKPPGNDSLGASGERHSSVEGKPILEFSGNRHDEPNHMPHLHIKCEEETEMPELATDAVRRSRSLKLKSSSHEIGLDVGGDYLQPGTSRGSEKSSKKVINHFSEERWMSTSKHTVRSRSSRNKREDYYSENRSALVEMNSDHVPKKQNWLLLLEQEEGYRYIPQLGDEVVYLSQGHQEYIEVSKTSKSGPWQKYKDKMRAVEFCEVEDLNYTVLPGSGSSCCQITLKFMETPYDCSGVKFQLTLPELNDFPDFIIEKTRYEAAMDRKWTTREECRVWWREEGSPNGGEWWDGMIVDVKDKSSRFPGSPWERYVVHYEDDTLDHFHSPWEFQDPMYLQNHPNIDYTIKEKISVDLADMVEKASKYQDRFGIWKLNEIALRSDFINRFPAPLSPKIIQSRLDNNYYRSLKALRHDIEVMISNAKSYFDKKMDFLKKMSRLFSYLNDKVLSGYE